MPIERLRFIEWRQALGPDQQRYPRLDNYFRRYRPAFEYRRKTTAVEKYVAKEDVFLANYSDGLTDLHLPTYMDFARRCNRVATFVSVRPNVSYHFAKADASGLVTDIEEVKESGVRINGGFFVLKKEIFRYMKPGEELVIEPFHRLIREKQLAAYEYDGFFAAMDTFKDKQQLDDLYETGQPPWEVWRDATGHSEPETQNLRELVR